MRSTSDCRKLAPFLCLTFLFVLVLCNGCSSLHQDKGSPEVTVLDDSFEELKAAFNADTTRPRLLALFSPTCGGCIYGAKALQHEAQQNPTAVQSADVCIVWVAMLDSDDLGAARKAARRQYPRPRVNSL